STDSKAEKKTTRVNKHTRVNKKDAANSDTTQGKAKAPVLLSEILKDARPLPPIVKKSHGPALARLQEIAASDARRAVDELEAIASKSTGDEASFALYSRAYLLFFKLHKNAAVITAATQYERRFAKGAEAEDMLWLRV